MLFNSYAFIFAFLPIILIGYFWFLRQRLILGSKIWLVGGSLFFYGYWSVVYVPLLLGSILVNFFVGSALSERESKWDHTTKKDFVNRISKKQLLIFGIIFNIALLAYFKYTDFFLENFNGIFAANIPLPHIVLPLGISFFTFTQIAFLVDAYKNDVKEYDLLHYMLFVTYFPHLLAGPILHHKEMMPQFANKWNFAIRWRNIAIGLFLFSIGLFKKVVIADTFATWANSGFDTSKILSFFEAWVTSLSYTFQLYFDFSGYVDMAIGMSLMFNIRLPINFNSPYKARDIQDFWRRWHITLSRFLRDYIYIPLGGNKVSRFRNYLNLFMVFFIGGLWHGASWMFVIWGTLHGIAIVIHRIWKDLGFHMWGWLAWLITFNFVNIAWVFFRAENWYMAKKVLTGMAGLSGIILPSAAANKLAFLGSYGIEFGGWLNSSGMKGTLDLVYLIFFIFFVFSFNNSNYFSSTFKTGKLYQIITPLMLFTGIVMLARYSEFLYFRF
ncbi:MAG: acetyltransferase [Sulfuricurvum sp. RIFOXYD2_FULL_44_160]|uniref:Membrane-bound O-acyltransferase family protein n=1 Tax=Sulfuricurvum kujiense TaxID=148813 RepID=A0A2D3WI62_9BACT|nr:MULTISPECIES: MBOAT family O-acyltransferase [Sulfuricurvum]OHD91856.1 MAG: acetyltransferase [Sulfuricurvum sp. RIFOXYD12_FULL_44_77]OHD95364.1 MAG: acetyltransferase [Sulfuricurvum sp. RIFOXYD2_FULL_44_160]DAB37966.1 MAG TPA: membrane-bound O-acyltransferase family protein [Sulfuricurvum kujiense]